MPKGTRKTPSGHEHLAAVALAMIAIVTLASADRFNASETSSIAHANTSANPYQPVLPYTPPLPTGRETSYPSYIRSSSSLPSSILRRRILVEERRVKTLLRQLQRVEKQMDALTAAIEVARPNNLLSLHSALDNYTAMRDRLEQRLAEANTRLEGYRLQQ